MPKKYNPPTIYAPVGTYNNAVEVGPDETLVVSAGIVGVTKEGKLVEDPTEQMELAWKNVMAWLEGVGMTRENLVKLTMYLSSPDHIVGCREARARVLGDRMDCAATGIIAQLFDPAMVIEIDVYAAK